MLKAFSDKMIIQSLTYTEYTLKAWKTLYVFVLLIAGYRKAASWQLLPGEVRVHVSAVAELGPTRTEGNEKGLTGSYPVWTG